MATIRVSRTEDFLVKHFGTAANPHPPTPTNSTEQFPPVSFLWQLLTFSSGKTNAICILITFPTSCVLIAFVQCKCAPPFMVVRMPGPSESGVPSPEFGKRRNEINCQVICQFICYFPPTVSCQGCTKPEPKGKPASKQNKHKT